MKEQFVHRIEFNSEELLLLAAVSLSGLVELPAGWLSPALVQPLLPKLREFVQKGVQRNAELHGENEVTNFVRALAQIYAQSDA